MWCSTLKSECLSQWHDKGSSTADTVNRGCNPSNSIQHRLRLWRLFFLWSGKKVYFHAILPARPGVRVESTRLIFSANEWCYWGAIAWGSIHKCVSVLLERANWGSRIDGPLKVMPASGGLVLWSFIQIKCRVELQTSAKLTPCRRGGAMDSRI